MVQSTASGSSKLEKDRKKSSHHAAHRLLNRFSTKTGSGYSRWKKRTTVLNTFDVGLLQQSHTEAVGRQMGDTAVEREDGL